MCTDCGDTCCSKSHALKTYPNRLVIHVKKFGQGGKKKNGGITYNTKLEIVGKVRASTKLRIVFRCFILDKVYNLDGIIIHNKESLKNGI